MNDYLLSFGGYDWLWKDDKDEAYDDFMSKNPSLDHYEAKLKTFSATEDEIGEEPLFRTLMVHSERSLQTTAKLSLAIDTKHNTYGSKGKAATTSQYCGACPRWSPRLSSRLACPLYPRAHRSADWSTNCLASTVGSG